MEQKFWECSNCLYNSRESKVQVCCWCLSSMEKNTIRHHLISVLQTTGPQKCYYVTRVFEPRIKTNGPEKNEKCLSTDVFRRIVVVFAEFSARTFASVKANLKYQVWLLFPVTVPLVIENIKGFVLANGLICKVFVLKRKELFVLTNIILFIHVKPQK